MLLVQFLLRGKSLSKRELFFSVVTVLYYMYSATIKKNLKSLTSKVFLLFDYKNIKEATFLGTASTFVSIFVSSELFVQFLDFSASLGNY